MCQTYIPTQNTADSSRLHLHVHDVLAAPAAPRNPVRQLPHVLGTSAAGEHADRLRLPQLGDPEHTAALTTNRIVKTGDRTNRTALRWLHLPTQEAVGPKGTEPAS